MKERFLSFTGQQYTPVTFGTFHGVFYGILKQAYGFTAANILSDEEKFGILRELTLNYGGDCSVRIVLDRFNSCRNIIFSSLKVDDSVFSSASWEISFADHF